MHIFYENHGCPTIFQNQTCINKQARIKNRLVFKKDSAPISVGFQKQVQLFNSKEKLQKGSPSLTTAFHSSSVQFFSDGSARR